MSLIRVLTVDDSVFIREALSDGTHSNPAIEIAGIASSGEQALALLPEIRPNLITLDLALPGMSGLATLTEIRKIRRDLPVILLSTFLEPPRSQLDSGCRDATDYIQKPTVGGGGSPDAIQQFREALITKIRNLCTPASVTAMTALTRTPVKTSVGAPIDIVAVGASTGGPDALADVIGKLPADFPAPVLIVQHMPPPFTYHLAERLDSLTPLRVRECRAGQTIGPGQVWVAPGGYHMTVARRGYDAMLMTNQRPAEQGCRPSVDVLFRSLVKTFGSNVLGVVLTGMGSDGTNGAQAIWDAGGEVIVQDEDTSAIWGMPGRIVAAGLARSICPLHSVAFAIMSRVYASSQPGKLAQAAVAK